MKRRHLGKLNTSKQQTTYTAESIKDTVVCRKSPGILIMKWTGRQTVRNAALLPFVSPPLKPERYATAQSPRRTVTSEHRRIMQPDDGLGPEPRSL